MRIGTWNGENRLMTEKHKELILSQDCDVWLLTEVHPKWAENDGTKILQFNAHFSKGVMGRNQHWSAVLSVLPLERLEDPHEASAAAKINGVTYCSTILPWRGVKAESAPWHGANHSEMTENAIKTLLANLPKIDVVWGGDWNHALIGKELCRGMSKVRNESMLKGYLTTMHTLSKSKNAIDLPPPAHFSHFKNPEG